MSPRADVLTQTLPVAAEPSLREGHMHSGRLMTADSPSSSPASPPDLPPPHSGQPPTATPQDNDAGNDEETDAESNRPLLSSSASGGSLPATAPPIPAPVSLTLPPTNAPDDVWNNSDLIPGSKKNQRIYHKAPFQSGQWTQEQWTKRFEFVKRKLEDLVWEHLRLVDQDSLPTYLPRMVGTCPEDAHPSVVVICRKAEFKAIRDLFQSPDTVKRLRVGKKPLVDRMLSSLIPHAEGEENVMPHLKLVYYQTSSAINRSALEQPLLANLVDGGLVCGGTIRYGERTATLGVAIKVGDRTGILTVDHLFHSKETTTHQPPPAVDNESFPSDESGSPVLAGSEWADSYSLWEDDDEYDDLDSDELAEAMDLDPQSVEPIQPAQDSGTHWTGLTSPEPEPWDRLASSAQLTSAPYLDWALTCPTPFASTLSHFLVNTVTPGVPGSEPAVLQSFHSAPVAHLAPVYIVSGIRGIIRGEILFAPSFIPSSPGHVSCEVWTVIPDASDGKAPRTHRADFLRLTLPSQMESSAENAAQSSWTKPPTMCTAMS
jgi:hypothetical protein